ncbi:MAG: MFS transporter [Haloferacaceae archaeon]
MNLRYRHTVLALLMGAFFSVMGARLILSPLVPAVMDTYGVTKGTVGIAMTGMWAAYGLCQFPGGVLGDRFGERRMLLAGIATTLAGGVLVALSPSFPAFALAAVLVGAGSGFYFPVAVALLTRLFENTGQALSFHVSGGNVSGLVTPLIAAYVGVRYGWRWAILVGAGLVLTMLLLCGWQIRPTGARREESVRESFAPGRALDLLTRPSIAYTTLLSILLGFVFQAVLSFFPTFLIEFHGFSTVRASSVFSTIFVIIVLLLPLLGRLSDARSPDLALAVSTAALLAGIALTLVRGPDLFVLVGAGLIGVGTTWGGVIGARFMEHLSEAEQATGYGLVRSVYVVLASTGNVLTGTIADVAGWASAFELLAALLAFALVLLAVNRAFSLDL